MDLKVLKPGGKFVNYEWVSTSVYDPENPDHVRCIDQINYANALPEMRRYHQIAEVARKVSQIKFRSLLHPDRNQE